MMSELHLYDFDGTLFRSPDRPDWWGSSSWVFEPTSMNPPCVPLKPGPDWWISSVVRDAKGSISDPSVYAVLCTGRALGSSHRYRVPELLKQRGLGFDEVHLNPGVPTKNFKASTVMGILRKHPEIEMVHVWEDTTENIDTIRKACKSLGKQCTPHLVKSSPHPVECTEQQAEQLAQEGWIRWKRSVRTVSARWMVSRRPTPESKVWEQDIKARKKHIAGAKRAFKELLPKLKPYAQEAREEFPGRDKQSISRRARIFVKKVKSDPNMVAYLDTWIGTTEHNPKAYSWRNQVIYQARNRLIGNASLQSVLEEVEKQADKGFEAISIAQSQKPVREILPDEIREFLPKNIVVEVDEKGIIQKVTDRFENEYETLARKIDRMHRLLSRYNEIVSMVRKDLQSGDEKTRLAALVTAIIMETGIRPGKMGNHTVKVQNGKDVPIETFGAITLGPGHIKFIRKNFARLEFVGKKGGKNIASLSSSDILDLLRHYVEKARKGGTKFIFVTDRGEQFTYSDLQRYFRERLSGFSPTDFRKLKATSVVLSNLREQQENLYEGIRKFSKKKTKDLKKRITDEIVEALTRAYTNAQEALSHESVSTTIEAYVNPEIVFSMLSRGRVEDNLEQAILSGKNALSFNPDVFITQATAKMAGLYRTSSLQSLLDVLEEDMEEEGIVAPT